LSVLHQSGSTTLDGATYTVDSAGNRTSKTDQYANVTSNYTAACPERSRRNPIYELTQVTQATTTTESYTYDAVGNRLSSLGVSPYSVNVSNELTSTPSTTYTYDNNGNTATKVDSTGTTTYAWDFENRLTSVTLPGSGGTVSFAYDPFGRRIKKVTSTTTSVFAYDGDNLVEETNSSGAVVARYEDTQNIDEPLAMLRGGATSYYHADGLGSITSLSNAAGSIAQTYTFDSFGKLTASTGSLVNPFQYTARESDTETGLYYYRARYYDPSAGRFLSEDPLGFTGEANFYRYAGNDVANLTDPLGLQRYPSGTPARRNCTPGELARCEAQCRETGVQHCYIVMHYGVAGLRRGKIKWKFLDGPMDCSCNDPDDPDCKKKRQQEPMPEPRGFPVPSPNWNRVAVGVGATVIVGGVIVVAVLCPECLLVLGPAVGAP
jgi:RHS repeat-associated protein